MDRIKQFMDSNLVPAIDRMTNNRYVKILMNAFMGISALTIGASFFTLARSLPLGEWYTNFLMNTGLYDVFNFPILITQELISLYLICALGYFTATSFHKKGINGTLIALGAFLMVTPFETAATFTTESGETLTSVITNVIPVSAFGSTGIFLAILVSILSVRLYVFMDDKNIKIKMPASVPENVTNMFETMIPATVIFVLFMLIKIGCAHTSFGSAQNLIYGILQAPLTHVGGGWIGCFVYVLVGLLLWIFGIHGAMLTYVAMAPIATAMWADNAVAFASGMAAPHPEWLYPLYITTIGGSGATLGLCLLLALRAKSKHLKTLGRLALPTSLFNINEPLIFGAPIVMNPSLAIPFIAAPMANFILTTLVNKLGFAVFTGAMLNNYLPVGIMGWMAANSWQGAVWQILLVVLDAVIYYPFFKAYDAKKVAEEKLSEESEEDDLL